MSDLSIAQPQPVSQSTPATITWKLTGYELFERAVTSCELCGHAIAQVFHVESSEGKHIVVGCECVNTLLSPDDRNRIELHKRREQRAGRQWREQKPPAREGETRVAYITRRVQEMANARRAYNAYVALDFEKARRACLAQLKADHPEYNDREFPWSEWCRVATEAERKAYDALYAQIETAYHANRFDFTRPVWEVRKI